MNGNVHTVISVSAITYTGYIFVPFPNTYMQFHCIQLLPDCAPRSVDYFIELLGLHNCAGCRFYRAEGRGHLWDAQGDSIKNVCCLWPSCIRGSPKAYSFVSELAVW
jgi:hypothetical protein